MDRTSVWPYLEKMKMGLMMGGITGMSVGFLVGTFTVLRYGPGEKGFVGTVATQMLQTGGFLGFIFSVGMLLRSDNDEAITDRRSLLFRRPAFHSAHIGLRHSSPIQTGRRFVDFSL